MVLLPMSSRVRLVEAVLAMGRHQLGRHPFDNTCGTNGSTFGHNKFPYTTLLLSYFLDSPGTVHSYLACMCIVGSQDIRNQP